MIDAQLFRPALAFNGLAPLHIQHVHRAVADVREDAGALELTETVDDGWIALREQTAPDEADAVLLAVETEGDALVAEQIRAKRLALAANPRHRQACREMDVRLADARDVQLLGDCHEREDVVVVVRRLVRDERLVPLAHAIEHAVVLQDAAGEDWLGVVGDEAGGCDRVRGLDVAVAMIDGDGLDAVEVPHALRASSPKSACATFASSIPSNKSSAVLVACGFPNEETSKVTFPILRR